jgi:hypothetical protein
MKREFSRIQREQNSIYIKKLTFSSTSSSYKLLASDPFCILITRVSRKVDSSGTLYTLTPCLVRSMLISEASLNRTEYNGRATGPKVSKICSSSSSKSFHAKLSKRSDILPPQGFLCPQRQTNFRYPRLAHLQKHDLAPLPYSPRPHILCQFQRF